MPKLHSTSLRLVELDARDPSTLGLSELIERVLDQTWRDHGRNGLDAEIARAVDRRTAYHLMTLARDTAASGQARAKAWVALEDLTVVLGTGTLDHDEAAHQRFARAEIEPFLEDPDEFIIPEPVMIPQGSPIGEEGGRW